ncbi:MAG: RNA polymerase sigma factor [Bacillota bacterium]|nr:RNA polymerase sigma factor [Bacillota bacterium]
MNDEKIIELYNKRSESAIAMTAESYSSYLMRVAYNVLGNYQDCEEVVSDSYMSAWNSIPPAKPSSLKFFIAKIVRNKAIDLALRKSAEKRGGGQVVLCLDELSDCVSDSGAAVDSGEITEIVNAFLRRQDLKKAKMFVRRYWYMDSIADIATYFNCSESKVKTTLFRMRQELKNELSKEGVSI